MTRIRRIRQMPMVTIIRMMGVMKKRLNPEATPPGADTDPGDDAAVVKKLEKKLAMLRKEDKKNG